MHSQTSCSQNWRVRWVKQKSLYILQTKATIEAVTSIILPRNTLRWTSRLFNLALTIQLVKQRRPVRKDGKDFSSSEWLVAKGKGTQDCDEITILLRISLILNLKHYSSWKHWMSYYMKEAIISLSYELMERGDGVSRKHRTSARCQWEPILSYLINPQENMKSRNCIIINVWTILKRQIKSFYDGVLKGFIFLWVLIKLTSRRTYFCICWTSEMVN